MRTLFFLNIDNAEGLQTEKDFVKASALTFRAYAFEKLVHYYCWRWQDSNNGASQGLVLRIDESTGGQGYATLAETYVQIYKDLDEAMPCITRVVWTVMPRTGMDAECKCCSCSLCSCCYN
ncbi:RagB/SusD family nutrient uptake outer membrane protein [Bacteroides cellulosilyticus]|uniref:RagB/SusD family nutrient uptake outer membrane protein n=1 Tax=Bacteroides cellulosilyticus TaxID=246787 RepID=UPI00216515B5|nr:RagB/SusD family nutrient uptake outer membrane protein [Bacteroides cellulosilyticus]MCS3057412.1 RagB/SusD family nutrient uptake outer membrane protein [Bacteroides cellulosilyticus]